MLLLLLFAFLAASEAQPQGFAWTKGRGVVDRYGNVLPHANLRCFLKSDGLASYSDRASFASVVDSSGTAFGGCAFAVKGGTPSTGLQVIRNLANGNTGLSFLDVSSFLSLWISISPSSSDLAIHAQG
jgi:hypothetical protein